MGDALLYPRKVLRGYSYSCRFPHPRAIFAASPTVGSSKKLSSLFR